MKEPGIREPAKLDLPDVGNGQAGIEKSLATIMIEVVADGDEPVGGEVVYEEALWEQVQSHAF